MSVSSRHGSKWLIDVLPWHFFLLFNETVHDHICLWLSEVTDTFEKTQHNLCRNDSIFLVHRKWAAVCFLQQTPPPPPPPPQRTSGNHTKTTRKIRHCRHWLMFTTSQMCRHLSHSHTITLTQTISWPYYLGRKSSAPSFLPFSFQASWLAGPGIAKKVAPTLARG